MCTYINNFAQQFCQGLLIDLLGTPDNYVTLKQIGVSNIM